MYATTDELIAEMRRAAKSHPAETERLRQIASLARRDLAKGAAAFAAWQSTISGSREARQLQLVVGGAGGAEKPQPTAPEIVQIPEIVQMPNDTPGNTRLRTDARQDVSGGVTQPGTERARVTSPASLPQNASAGPVVQSTPSGMADSRRDDAAWLRTQIADCLRKETNPALRLFLERLRRDSHKYPAGFLQQELEAYLHAANSDDFLSRLAALHWQWTLDDVAADPDGHWLKRGDTVQRQAVLARLRDTIEKETDLMLRCHLAGLARESVTDPVDVDNKLDDYFRNRTSPNWVWLATVRVTGNPEAAFQWRLQEARRKVTDPRLPGYLDSIEQTAHESLPLAISKLEAFVELAALLDGPANAAQNTHHNTVIAMVSRRP